MIYQRGTISSVVSDDTDQEDIMPRGDNRGNETGNGPRRAQEQLKLIAKSQAKTGDTTVKTRRG